MTFTPDRDAIFVSTSGDVNFGGATILGTGRSSGNNHSVLSFDVSALAGNYVTIEAITLRLFVQNNVTTTATLTPQVAAITAANRNWTEGTGNSIGVPTNIGDSTWNERGRSVTSWAGSGGLSTAGIDYDSAILASNKNPG